MNGDQALPTDGEAEAVDASPEVFFRQPPARITAECAAYMDRVQEQREFLSAFFSMVKAFQPLVTAFTNAAPKAREGYL
jgi:hypothetical protein